MHLIAKEPVGRMFSNAVDAVKQGLDPEIFVTSNGKLVPAYEFLPDKHSPVIVRGSHYATYQVFGVNDYSTYAYWDGFQAEFRTGAAFKCLMFMTLYTQQGLKSILDAAKAKFPNAKLSLNSVMRVPLKTREEAFDPFVTLGCDPSMNAYDLSGIEVKNPRKLPYRFAGGHMHFGEDYMQKNHVKVVKALDKILGLWSVGAAQSFDNPIRRKYYGLPGEYRTPQHGLEYRVLSNFWLSSPIILHAAWEIGRRAVYLAQTEYDELWVAPEEMVIEAIANGDVKIAHQLLKLNKPIFMWMMKGRGWSESTIAKLFDIGLNGIESVIDDPEAIEKNWLFGETIDARLEREPRYTFQAYAERTFPKKG